MFMTVLKATHETLQKQKYPVDFESMDFMHKWLTSQLDSSRKDEHILFAMKYVGSAMFLYIQSDSEFPLKNVERAGMALVQSFPLPTPKSGDKIQFSLFCSADKAKDGRRRFIDSPEERSAWLKRKTSGALNVEASKEVGITSKHVKSPSEKPTRVPGVEFFGSGTVTDPAAFEELVRNGVGRCKSYGFGLLLYRPA